jgi:hypothetical protein
LRGQIDRNKRPETGLDVGDKKDEPVESAEALRRWFQRRFCSTWLIKLRGSGFIGAPAAVISIVAKAA